jgi:hypothetical protein
MIGEEEIDPQDGVPPSSIEITCYVCNYDFIYVLKPEDSYTDLKLLGSGVCSGCENKCLTCVSKTKDPNNNMGICLHCYDAHLKEEDEIADENTDEDDDDEDENKEAMSYKKRNKDDEEINNDEDYPSMQNPNSSEATGSASNIPLSAKSDKIVNKVLPGDGKEVFSISSNKYTYYDSEPLCKALGAELATYDQVKQAWANGADWCNYGWIKGQMAVYPTSQTTYAKLQKGTPEQRLVCGRPGLNGGHFDNPELRFGVNCYGVKPPQKDHDATAITSGEGAPLSPGMLEFDKKVNKYRGDASSIAILPFNKTAWSN